MLKLLFYWLLFYQAVSVLSAGIPGIRVLSSTTASVQERANVTVSWDGGEPKCGSCEWGIKAEQFACSSYDWEWNSGIWRLLLN
jgi:hypothetical protein